jgi:hypothetical protein
VISLTQKTDKARIEGKEEITEAERYRLMIAEYTGKIQQEKNLDVIFALTSLLLSREQETK